MASNVIINGVTYPAVPSVNIPKSGGGTAVFYDDSDANAATSDVLSGKTFYAGGKHTGAMVNNGSIHGEIATKDGEYSIPAGYTSGGAVMIQGAAVVDLVSGNVKSGATILGVQGSPTVVDTAIAADAADATTILSGFKAFVNGSLLTGSATMPTVSQDSTTKVLTIS